VNPLEFVALTPKSNCAQCGHPTCLAFAVAVTKGGASPAACPFIATAELPAELSLETTGSLDRVAKGQDERDMALVAHLKSKLDDLDFEQVAANIGAGWAAEDTNILLLSYLGRQVVMGRDDLEVDGGQLVDPRDQILLYNYAASGGVHPPAESWVGMESLPNSISKIRTLETYCERRIAECFSGRGPLLLKCCQQLEGRAGKGEQSADVGMVVPVLPRVPLYLLFWDEEPEDGFEAKVKILFDQQVMEFLDLESLVFAAERLADRLMELAQV